MPAAPIPPNEDPRLACLRSLDILDTPPDATFDDLASLAAEVTGCPTAFVSLVDGCRQWFKALVGMDAPETARDRAFCAYAILQSEPLVVPDARRDPRFSDNPLVTGAPHFQAYAGHPIVIDGQAVGTVCVFDVRPREFTASQLRTLRTLARQTAVLMQHRRVIRQAEQVERRLLAFIDHSPMMAYLKSPDGRLQYVNRALKEVAKQRTDALLGKRDEDWLPEEVAERNARNDDWVRRTENALETLEQIPTGDAEIREWATVKFPVRLDDGVWVGGICIDITDRLRAEAALRERERQFRATLDSLQEGIIVQDATGKVQIWNPSAETLLGLSADQLSGRTPMAPGWHLLREDRTEFPRHEHPTMQALQTGQPQPPEIMGLQRSDGELRWFIVIASPIMGPDGMTPTAAVASFLDITERLNERLLIEDQMRRIQDTAVTLEVQRAALEDANERLFVLANYDGLTGALNRRAFQLALTEEVTNLTEAIQPSSLAIFDIDFFKTINDELGHQAGDRVLIELVALVQSQLRSQDVFGRIGGEEFAILMPSTDHDEAMVQMEAVRAIVASAVIAETAVTISIGVATYRDGQDVDGYLRVADDALYRSKRGGRNRVTSGEVCDEKVA